MYVIKNNMKRPPSGPQKPLTFNELGAFSFKKFKQKKTLIAKGPFFVFFINLNAKQIFI